MSKHRVENCTVPYCDKCAARIKEEAQEGRKQLAEVLLAPSTPNSSEWLTPILDLMAEERCCKHGNGSPSRAAEKAKQAIEAHYTTQLSNELIKARINELEHIDEAKKRTKLWFSDVYDVGGITIIERTAKLKAQLNLTKETT